PTAAHAPAWLWNEHRLHTLARIPAAKRILGSMAATSRARERLPRDGWWPALVGGLAGRFALVLACSIACGFLLRLVARPDGSTRLDSWITERLVAHRTDALTSLANGVSRV